MHHKFCVIDLQTTIHGSYNWSKKSGGKTFTGGARIALKKSEKGRILMIVGSPTE